MMCVERYISPSLRAAACQGKDAYSRRIAQMVARAALQTIIDNTGSTYTVDELTRILGEAV